MTVAQERERSAEQIPAEAWNALLAFLGGDSAGGAAYEDLRRRLQFFFEWKGCAGAAELADETLNRVATKLANGEIIHTEEPRRYAFGIARFVYLEAVRRDVRAATVARSERAASHADEDAEQRDARLAALDACLGNLPPRTQQLMLRYHSGDGRQRIDHRKRLADELGIALNALRIRVHRLRAQIEECVRDRLLRNAPNLVPMRGTSSR